MKNSNMTKRSLLIAAGIFSIGLWAGAQTNQFYFSPSLPISLGNGSSNAYYNISLTNSGTSGRGNGVYIKNDYYNGGGNALYVEQKVDCCGYLKAIQGVAYSVLPVNGYGYSYAYGIHGTAGNAENNNLGVYGELLGVRKGAAVMGTVGANHTIDEGQWAGCFFGNTYTSGVVGIGYNKWNPSAALDVYGNILYSGSCSQSSDLRLKTNVKDLGSSLKQIEKLRPVTYHLLPEDLSKYYESLPDTVVIDNDDELWNYFKLGERLDVNRKHIGFIAQEIMEIFPELVYEDKKGMLSVDYISLIPVLVGTAQEQNGIIQNLSHQIESVQAANEMIIKRLESLENNIASVVQEANHFSFSIFPNPASDFVTIDYTLHVDAPICIELYSMFGQRLKLIVPQQNQTAGQYSAQMSVADLNAGTYMVKATSGKQFESKQLLVNH